MDRKTPGRCAEKYCDGKTLARQMRSQQKRKSFEIDHVEVMYLFASLAPALAVFIAQASNK